MATFFSKPLFFRNLEISKSRNLEISKSRNLEISKSRNLGISESRNLGISEKRKNGKTEKRKNGKTEKRKKERTPDGGRRTSLYPISELGPPKNLTKKSFFFCENRWWPPEYVRSAAFMPASSPLIQFFHFQILQELVHEPTPTPLPI